MYKRKSGDADLTSEPNKRTKLDNDARNRDISNIVMQTGISLESVEKFYDYSSLLHYGNSNKVMDDIEYILVIVKNVNVSFEKVIDGFYNFTNLRVGCYCQHCDDEHYIVICIPTFYKWFNDIVINATADYVYENANSVLKKKFTVNCSTTDEIGIGSYELTEFLLNFWQYDKLLKDGNERQKDIFENSIYDKDNEVDMLVLI